MSVGVMEDYKLRDLRVSHSVTLGWGAVVYYKSKARTTESI